MKGKKFRLSQKSLLDIIRNQSREIERLKKKYAELKAKDDLAKRHLQGALGALYGEKQV